MARATDALEVLRELTRGVFPTQLGRAGLGPALGSLAAHTGRPMTLVLDDSVAGRRFSARGGGGGPSLLHRGAAYGAGGGPHRAADRDRDLVLEIAGAGPEAEVVQLLVRLPATAADLPDGMLAGTA